MRMQALPLRREVSTSRRLKLQHDLDPLKMHERRDFKKSIMLGKANADTPEMDKVAHCIAP